MDPGMLTLYFFTKISNKCILNILKYQYQFQYFTKIKNFRINNFFYIAFTYMNLINVIFWLSIHENILQKTEYF